MSINQLLLPMYQLCDERRHFLLKLATSRILGVLGEYVGRSFMSANGKPQGVVREILPARDEGRAP